MKPSYKDTRVLLQNYYYIINIQIPKITAEILNKDKELKEIIEALTLTANKITDEAHGSGISKPVERIAELKEKILKEFEDNLEEISNELTVCNKKRRIYEKWFKDSNLNTTEMDVIKYTFSDGLTEWKIGNKLGYESRNVRRIRKSALEKLSLNVLIDVVY